MILPLLHNLELFYGEDPNSIYNRGYKDAATAIINSIKIEPYVLSETTNPTDTEITRHYAIPYNGHRYMALVGMSSGAAQFDLDTLTGWFTYPKITEYINGNVSFSGTVTQASSGALVPYLCDSNAGNTLEFDVTYKHEDIHTQTVPLHIVWFD